jgi:hypothetical protein
MALTEKQKEIMADIYKEAGIQPVKVKGNKNKFATYRSEWRKEFKTPAWSKL